MKSTRDSIGNVLSVLIYVKIHYFEKVKFC
jgi:hypothetical protein